MNTPDNILDRKVWVLRQSIAHEKSLLREAIGNELWDALEFILTVPTYYAIASSKKYGIDLLTEREGDEQVYYVFQSWYFDPIRREGPHFCDKFRFSANDFDQLHDCLATLAGRTIIVTENMTASPSTTKDSFATDQARNFYNEDFGRFIAAIFQRNNGG